MNRFKYMVIVMLALVIVVYRNGMLFIRILHFDNHLKNASNTKELFENITDAKTYRILLWTKYFNSNDWLKLNLKDLKCEYSNCMLTVDRRNLSINDGIVFHWRDINVRDLPSHKLYNQKWVLFNMESPIYTPIDNIYPLLEHINWTMTYRLDSDIYTPYGRIEKCINNWKPNYKFTDKKKNIAWIVSHCHTHSNRDKYVQELQKFIDIDIYGSCGNLSCNHDSSCYRMIEQNYKYYLSFENSLCKDYVTEKLFKFIRYDVIPIVLGAANYTNLMPSNSYVDIFNFSSPQHLASFLREIGSDEKQYNSYFNWKNNYCVEETHWTFFCDLCKKFNTQTLEHKNRSDLIKFWFQEANCSSKLNY